VFSKGKISPFVQLAKTGKMKEYEEYHYSNFITFEGNSKNYNK